SELVIGGEHRIARNAKIAGERAARGKARSGLQPPFQNGCAQGKVKLPVQRRRPIRIKGKGAELGVFDPAGHDRGQQVSSLYHFIQEKGANCTYSRERSRFSSSFPARCCNLVKMLKINPSISLQVRR